MSSSTSKAHLWRTAISLTCLAVALSVALGVALSIAWMLTQEDSGSRFNDPWVDSDRRSSGWCATWLGDVDEDGQDDFLLSIPDEPDEGEWIGLVRIVSGRDGSTLSTMRQVHGTHFESVLPAGDVDGDGRSDLFVHDRFPDRTRVVSADLTTEILAMEDSWEFGARPAGDLDGDGHGDILIAESRANGGGESRGRVRVLSGADGSMLREHVGEADEEFLGCDVGDLGDVDGDGVHDYAISTASSLYEKRADSFVLLHSGRDGGVLRKIQGVRKDGFQSWIHLAPTGDLDRDGVNDLLLGGCSRNSAGEWDGIAFALVSGKAGAFLWRRFLEVSHYEFGDVGDVNGDGCSDLFFGSDESWTIESGCGGEILFTAEGRSWGTGSGDANGDGHADLLRLTNRWEPQGPELWKDGLIEVVSGRDGSVLVWIDENSLSRTR